MNANCLIILADERDNIHDNPFELRDLDFISTIIKNKIVISNVVDGVVSYSKGEADHEIMQLPLYDFMRTHKEYCIFMESTNKTIVGNCGLSFGIALVIRCAADAPGHDKITARMLSDYKFVFKRQNKSGVTYEVYRMGVAPELGYIELIDEILQKRNKPMRPGRNGNTIGVFNRQLRFDISGGLVPSSTASGGTWLKGLLVEFTEFIAGRTSSTRMEAQGVNVWRDNTSKSFLNERGLDYVEGTIGPCYGHNYRHYGGEYVLEDGEYVSHGGIDQLQQVIDGLVRDPYSRRHIITNWNPTQNAQCPLPPCQLYFQFYVDDGKLTCFAMNRSSDICCAGMWNSAFAALLTHYIAAETGLAAYWLIMQFNDVHIYENQIEFALEHVKRAPAAPFPRVQIKDKKIVIEERDTHLYWPKIKYPMST